MFVRDEGGLREAVAELRRAAELAPYSVMASVNLAYGLLAEGNDSAALEQARRAVALAPELASASMALVRASRAVAQTKDSDAALARAIGSTNGDPHALALVACELARLGRREEAFRAVKPLECVPPHPHLSPFPPRTPPPT